MQSSLRESHIQRGRGLKPPCCALNSLRSGSTQQGDIFHVRFFAKQKISHRIYPRPRCVPYSGIRLRRPIAIKEINNIYPPFYFNFVLITMTCHYKLIKRDLMNFDKKFRGFNISFLIYYLLISFNIIIK